MVQETLCGVPRASECRIRHKNILLFSRNSQSAAHRGHRQSHAASVALRKPSAWFWRVGVAPNLWISISVKLNPADTECLLYSYFSGWIRTKINVYKIPVEISYTRIFVKIKAT